MFESLKGLLRENEHPIAEPDKEVVSNCVVSLSVAVDGKVRDVVLVVFIPRHIEDRAKGAKQQLGKDKRKNLRFFDLNEKYDDDLSAHHSLKFAFFAPGLERIQHDFGVVSGSGIEFLMKN